MVILGHGASGTAASMRPHVEGLRARGLEAEAIDLPRSRAERAVATFAAAAAPHGAAVVAGGHSYGGRVASMLAAEQPVAGLVLLSYPLHRPGHPGELRTEHWPRIACPVLLLSGESDPFARIDLLRGALPLLGDARLITYPRVGHGLAPVLDDVLDHIAAFVSRLGVPAEYTPAHDRSHLRHQAHHPLRRHPDRAHRRARDDDASRSRLTRTRHRV